MNADVTQDDPALQSALEACNNYTKASITYTFGSQTTTLNGDTIKDWLQFDEKGQLIWDDNSFQQHVADYVAQQLLMIRSVRSVSSRPQVAEPFTFPVLYMAGKSIRLPRLLS